jgi:hypothetical protein
MKYDFANTIHPGSGNFFILVLQCTTENKCYRIPKSQSKMDNPWKLAIYGTQDKEKQNKIKTQHNMCWTPLYTI